MARQILITNKLTREEILLLEVTFSSINISKYPCGYLLFQSQQLETPEHGVTYFEI